MDEKQQTNLFFMHGLWACGEESGSEPDKPISSECDVCGASDWRIQNQGDLNGHNGLRL